MAIVSWTSTWPIYEIRHLVDHIVRYVEKKVDRLLKALVLDCSSYLNEEILVAHICICHCKRYFLLHDLFDCTV